MDTVVMVRLMEDGYFYLVCVKNGFVVDYKGGPYLTQNDALRAWLESLP